MSKKQKSAVLNQTVFPHELNTGVTIRLTEFAVVNKGCSFIDSNTIQRYVVMYLAKYGVPKDVVNQEYKTGNQFDHRWRDRDVKFRISSEGESTNLLVKIYAQFFTKGYIMNGYEEEKQIYELSVCHIPTAILSSSISDHHTTIFTSHVDELNARINAGINRRID